ncbi:MAG: TolC family protein [Nitrospirae bacterium]|nr:TolC family protein [Nitrospirota bacterium]
MRKQSFHHVAVIFSTVCWLWTGSVMAQEQPVQYAITVEEVVRIALQQNLELKIQEQDIRIAQGDLIQTRLYLNPELDLQGETDAPFSNEGSGRFSVGLSQTFLVGSKRRHRIGIAELNLGRTQKAVENARRLLIAEVKEAFYTVLLLQEKLKLADELIALNERLVELTEGRFREGFSPELDLNLARIQLQQVQRSRAEIEKALADARSGLNVLLGQPAHAPVIAQGVFSDRELDLDLARLTQAAFSQRADLTAREVALSMAGTAIDLAKADRLPDVTLSVDYTQERSVFSGLNFTDRGRLAGLKLSVPIPLFNRNQGEILQANVRREQASLERDLLRARIEQEVTNTATRLRVAQQILTRSREAILPLSERHFRQTEAAYAQGQASILDVMEAQRRFSEARLGSLEAQYEYNVALVELERVIGLNPTRPETSGSQEGGMK